MEQTNITLRKVLFEATESAHQYHGLSRSVTTLNVLLAIMENNDGNTARNIIEKSFGIEPTSFIASIREKSEEIKFRTDLDEEVGIVPLFSAAVLNAIDLGEVYMGQKKSGTASLLAGLALMEDSHAGTVLKHYGITAEGVKKAVAPKQG